MAKYRIIKVNKELHLIQKKTWLGWRTIEDWYREDTAISRFHKLASGSIEYKKEQIILEN